MKVTLTWDDEEKSIIRWEFAQPIGRINYIKPINETAELALSTDNDAVAIINMGWKAIFPNRSYKHLYHAIMAAPANLKLIIIVTKNPLARQVIKNRLIKRFTDLEERVQLVSDLDEARQLANEHLAKED
jgi:hypothetical protein